jgi:penicillin-binding protein-related factor A (putative recombinase)
MERDFQDELGNGAMVRPEITHFHKLPDNPIFHGMRNRFITKKPYDCLLCCPQLKGHLVAMELKQVHSESVNVAGKIETPSSGLQFHQEKALLDVAASGGFGLLVVNFQKKLTGKRALKEGATIDRAFAAHIADVVAARRTECSDSLKISWFAKKGFEFSRCAGEDGKPAWDPLPLVGWLWELV